jgi:hypothetical protein
MLAGNGFKKNHPRFLFYLLKMRFTIDILSNPERVCLRTIFVRNKVLKATRTLAVR